MTKQALLTRLSREGYSPRIIDAFHVVARESFIPDHMLELAYEDMPLPIGHGQTISQPSTIAFMLQNLTPSDGDKILEVGCGCGYVLALLHTLCPSSPIYGVEIIGELAATAAQHLRQFSRVHVVHADGYHGYDKAAPFDRILVSAAAQTMPDAIIGQLVDGGIAVVVVNNDICKVTRVDNSFKVLRYPGFVFVPLVKSEKSGL